MDIEQRIEAFRANLPLMDDRRMVGRHVLGGSCFALSDDDHFGLCDTVSDHFGVHPSEVVVVGSAKLGFSIAPMKPWRPFGDTSDIDVAVVSDRLFEQYWRRTADYARRDRGWDSAPFARYLFAGWIRPDKLPPSISSDWWDFFRLLWNSRRFGIVKISAGLYKSWDFLSAYQERAVGVCRTKEQL